MFPSNVAYPASMRDAVDKPLAKIFLYDDDRADYAVFCTHQLLLGTQTGAVEYPLNTCWEFLNDDASLKTPGAPGAQNTWVSLQGQESFDTHLTFLATALRDDIEALTRLRTIVNQALELQQHRLNQLAVVKLKG